MTTTFIISAILETLAAVLIVLGFAFEEKVIAFEEKCEDKIAHMIARFLIKNRFTKNIVRKSPEHVQKRAETNFVCGAAPTPVNTPERKRTGRVA